MFLLLGERGNFKNSSIRHRALESTSYPSSNILVTSFRPLTASSLENVMLTQKLL